MLFFFKLQSANLTVIQPSDITKVGGDFSVNEGGVARLICEAEGYPPPTIYWTREERGEMITIWRHGRKIQGWYFLSKFESPEASNIITCALKNGKNIFVYSILYYYYKHTSILLVRTYYAVRYGKLENYILSQIGKSKSLLKHCPRIRKCWIHFYIANQ